MPYIIKMIRIENCLGFKGFAEIQMIANTLILTFDRWKAVNF